MEEYPVKLAVIYRINGTVQPARCGEYMDVTEVTGLFSGWQIRVDSLLSAAVPGYNGFYRPMVKPRLVWQHL